LGSSIIICFILTAFIVSNNTKTVSIINVLIIAFFVRLCISLVFDSIGLVGDTERFGSEFNANTIGFGTLFIVALVIAKKVYTNKISKFEIFCLIVSVAVIIATASRKNLIALIILGIGYVYINRGRNTVINSIKVSFSILIIAFFSYLVLNNTTMGDRIIRGYEQTMTALESGDEEYMFENRARYYVDGWKYFKNNPINGIGLTNFRVYDERERALHTEYMAQLTEGGIIGASLFLIFYIYILLKLNKIRRLYTDLNKKALLYILFMVVMLFLFTGTWIYRVPIMWVLIALSVRFIYVVRHNKLSRTSKNQLRYQN
jgi:O-antigen ligase